MKTHKDAQSYLPALRKVVAEAGRTGAFPIAAGQDPTKQKKLSEAQRRKVAKVAKILDEYKP